MLLNNPTAAPVDIQVLGVGSNEWVMPDGAKMVYVNLIAAGGGGAGGWRGTPVDQTSGPGYGGKGGTGGGWAFMQFPAGMLPPTVEVSVGRGGRGGEAATVDGGPGADGTAGGDTYFGEFLIVRGGSYFPTNFPGVPSTIPSMVEPGAGTADFSAGCPGGGSGAGITVVPNGLDSNGVTLYEPVAEPGGPGQVSSLTYLLPGTLGVDAGQAGGDGQDSTAQGPGSGGGGGGGSLTGPGGDGGDGGNYGAGGGGGGASPDGFDSGRGGNGGDGIAVIATYF